jgi:hypothetical protein
VRFGVSFERLTGSAKCVSRVVSLRGVAEGHPGLIHQSAVAW